MPKRTQFKVGRVFVREIAPGKWRGSWTDPLTRAHVRRLLHGNTFAKAQASAAKIDTELAQGRGWEVRERGGSGGLTVRQAVHQAVMHSSANRESRQGYVFMANTIFDWIDENAAGVAAWNDLTTGLVEGFILHCRNEGQAYDTIRRKLAVLRLTDGFMARVHGSKPIMVGVRLNRGAPTQAALDEADAILSPDQLRDILAWLKSNSPMFHTLAMLQGLAGLRLMEAACLKESDYDPEARTVTVAKNEAHTPKNAASFRTIPVAPAVAAAIEQWIDSLPIRHPLGFLFFPLKSCRRREAKSIQAEAGVYRVDHISRMWSKALASAKGKKIDEREIKLPGSFTPRRLRGTFITALRSAGCDFETLQKYIGHAPSSVLARHYDRVGLDRLAAVARLAQDLHDARGAFAVEVENAAKTGSALH